MTSTRLRSLAGLAVVAAVTLSGCSSVPALNGGAAARVGDDSVSLDDVATTAAAYCSAVETQLTEGQAVPNSVVRAQVAGALALRAAADQFAAEEGVSADPVFKTDESTLEASLGGLDEKQKEAVRQVNLARPYVAAVEIAVGKKLVSGADGQEALKAGSEAFRAWLEDHDVRIDPRFSVSIAEGEIARTDTEVSFPVSQTARNATSGDADQAYATSLPASQRCGG